MYKLAFPSEKIIEDYVFYQTSKYGECPITETYPSKVYRQLKLGAYGITDIVKIFVEPDRINVVVLELKNEPLKAAHLSQLCRYLTGVKKLCQRYKRLATNGDWLPVYIHGELAGPLEPNRDDFVFLANYLHENITIYDISLTMDCGFRAKNIGREWINEGDDFNSLKDVVREVYDCAIAAAEFNTPDLRIVEPS